MRILWPFLEQQLAAVVDDVGDADDFLFASGQAGKRTQIDESGASGRPPVSCRRKSWLVSRRNKSERL